MSSLSLLTGLRFLLCIASSLSAASASSGPSCPSPPLIMSKSHLALSVASSAFQSRASSPVRVLAQTDRQRRLSTRASNLQTVVVLGGSYAGAHAAEILSRELPAGWRVILVERNSHFHHIYQFPRYGVIPVHAHKAFIPFTGLLRKGPAADKSTSSEPNSENAPSQSDVRAPADPERHRVIQAAVVNIGRNFITLDRPVSLKASSRTSLRVPTHDRPADDRDSGYEEVIASLDSVTSLSDMPEGLLARTGSPESVRLPPADDMSSYESNDGKAESADEYPTTRIEWDFLIYALGSHPPPPLQLSLDKLKSNLQNTSPGRDNSEKRKAVDFFIKQGRSIENAKRIVIVGGGALGIQYATDITSHLRNGEGAGKDVTLIHSRNTFLPLFLHEINDAVKQRLQELGVKTKLGERVDLESVRQQIAEQESGKRLEVEVRGVSGTLLATGDLVLLCTGQRPNTGLMAAFCPTCVPGGISSQDPGSIQVLRSMQIAASPFGPSPVVASGEEKSTCDCVESSPWSVHCDLSHQSQEDKATHSAGNLSVLIPSLCQNRLETTCTEDSNTTRRSSKLKQQQHDPNDPLWKRVFAVGDCCDAFGAIKAGHTGWYQAEVASNNVLKMIRGLERGVSVEKYEIAKEGQEVAVASNSSSGGSEEDDLLLARYEPTKPMMKLTLGIDRSVSQLRILEPPYDLEITHQYKRTPDEGWDHMWRSLGMSDEDPWA